MDFDGKDSYAYRGSRKTPHLRLTGSFSRTDSSGKFEITKFEYSFCVPLNGKNWTVEIYPYTVLYNGVVVLFHYSNQCTSESE